ncbi:unnamed protein product [Pseudo-nitzschia multistriata]|uniref:Uncharacterized protein n=1 Tax=Pseudo-nitzschia multistriata TaxID=183589 RepID=A0A448ZBM4_9STRA|nr:unnamed protein product [Pseudo-nitzschia multistriata]
MEANNNGLDLHYRNDNDSNVQQPTKRGSPDEVETTSDMSKGTCNRRPSKRQRMASYMDGINNTSGSATNRMKSMISVTPYGECANPYHNDVDNQNDENISDSNDDKINRTLLQQALTYYEIAYRMLVSEENVLVSQAMVILNNIGHIHRLMGSEENAKEYFQRLLTTMMYLQQTSDSRQIKHWDSFFTNVVDLVVPPNLSHKKYAAAA